jgi:hypothetical protein
MSNNSKDVSSIPEDIDQSKFSQKNLEILRKEFPECKDEELVRFLVKRKDNLRNARFQLKKALQIRKQLHLPILKSSILKEMKTGKVYCHGTDKEGGPIMILRTSLNHVSQRDLEETKRLLVWWTEYCIREKLPENHSKVTILVHTDGTSNDNMDSALYKQCVPMFQVRFPCSLVFLCSLFVVFVSLLNLDTVSFKNQCLYCLSCFHICL